MKARQRRSASKSYSFSKIFTSIGLSLGLLSTSPVYAAANPAVSFTDIGQNFSWAMPAIQALVSANIVSGRDSSHFAPQAPVTRAEFAKLLVLALKLPLVKPDNPTFSDVPQSFWGYSYIETAYKNGLIFGVGDRRFAPGDPVKREDVVTMIGRALLKDSLDSLNVSNIQTFSDYQSIDPYARGGVAAATQLHIVNGYVDKTFRPQGLTNRAEASQIIYQTMNVSTDQIHSLEIPKITISQLPAQLKIGDKQSFTATVAYPDGTTSNAPIHWSVAGGTGTIDTQGMFTATNSGTGTVQADVYLPNGRQVSASVPVQVAAPISKLVLNPDVIEMTSGESQAITVTAFDANGNSVNPPAVTWSVTGNIGTVSNNGTFQATQAGQGTITATLAQAGQAPVTASLPVVVLTPYHLSILPETTSAYYPGQNIPVKVQLLDDKNQPVNTDSSRSITLTVTMPDGGTYTRTAIDANGIATFSLSHTLAGNYSVTASGEHLIQSQADSFTVLPGAPAALNVFATPSPWVTPNQSVALKAVAVDTWGNVLPNIHLPVQVSLSDSQHGAFAAVNGTTGSDSSIGSFVAGQTKGDTTVNVTATSDGQPITGSTTLHVYTAQGAGLVSGKGVWMMWSDWKNHNVDDTLAKLKQAGVTHIYLEVATTSDGFYGKDALNDFLPKAHDQGFVVIGWIYAQLKDPYADAAQTIQVAQYATPRGDKVDGIAADLEDATYLSATNLDTYSKSLRSNLGDNYPLIAVTYPESWRPNLPWTTFAQYYDVIAPMDYWHYNEKSYSYDTVYNQIKPEVDNIRKATGNPYIAVTMIGQSYNMFNDAGQEPTGTEITAAMQAAKDSGSVGYSTYRMFTATPDEWNAFANFKW
ncbi:S-layer homology domain-containing protein [Fodinisporobacter ferrooxydans]|uniref:S-layer homology domain-containing protein n=1 Tax=Fodinisporobacter ferrooxydans TaxID=2901836 RepID=A0ABY4CNP5_9BACL|nr:S-layer homology domain-containing protein [Alicyclobacillaceae bacterium MYW30-H2]